MPFRHTKVFASFIFRGPYTRTAANAEHLLGSNFVNLLKLATRKPPAPMASGSDSELELPILTKDPSSWKGSSLLSSTQITPDGLEMLFRVSKEMRDLVRSSGGDNRLQHKVLGTVFFEASTRTSCSFQAAMMRLGGKNIHVDGKGNSSAAQKGETLEDTIRCLECYTDITVLRHPVQGSVGKVIQKATKPILNAGDGVGEHPTQALLDVFTIYDELNIPEEKLPQLVVVLLGDLKHGRTVHSLAKLLGKASVSQKVVLRYCSPEGLEMPDYVKNFVGQHANVEQETCEDLKQACDGAHVLYVTRVQKERFVSEEAYEQVKVRRDVDVMVESIGNVVVSHEFRSAV
jgi:aspartate carbamoyltransferase catalytic subunit